ncbi:MAG: hypothetical protein K6G69_10990 [Lachnospiraceae bacterium]|nr:hypothetical protein [Lachnospiraceae bacterium]
MNNNIKAEKAYANKVACNLYTIVTFVLALAYLVQFIQGSRTLLIFTILMIADIGPWIACKVIYRNDPASEIIRHVMAIGYAIFYLLICFTSPEQQVYVYAVPMMLVIMLFNDFAFSVKISVGVGVIAIAHAIVFTARKGWTHEALAAMEIEVALMVLVSVFTIIVSRVIANLNKQKIDSINEAGQKTEHMLDSIKQISGILIDKVGEISDKMTTLTASSEETLSAMQEIQTGTGDTAESVQNQLYKTEEIQNQIDKVTQAANSIGDDVVISADACQEGSENINRLIEQSKVSEEAGNKVMAEVDDLKNSTAQMQSIVELIKNVASQTSLLALNASIEAARAGEAGRGFAVVATEISNLAGQTQTATGDISDLIAGIGKEMKEVVSAIDSLVESNKIQNESAAVTKDSFERIVGSIGGIRTNYQELSDIVNTLVSANQEIVESIQTISAITEEVSAHTNNTCASTEQTEQIIESVQEIVEQMNGNAEELKSLT